MVFLAPRFLHVSEASPDGKPPPGPALPQAASGGRTACLCLPDRLHSRVRPCGRGQDLASRSVPWSPASGGGCLLTSLHRASSEPRPLAPLLLKRYPPPSHLFPDRPHGPPPRAGFQQPHCWQGAYCRPGSVRFFMGIASLDFCNNPGMEI